jgi:hypothetical protein
MTISRRDRWPRAGRALIAVILIALLAPVAAVWNAAPASASTMVLDQFGTAHDDVAYDVGVDAVSGAMYLVGVSNYSSGFVRGYDSSGALTWQDSVGSGVYGVTVDANGNVYIAGYTYDTLVTPVIGGEDAFVRMYDADGVEQWTWQLGTEVDDWAGVVLVDGDGNVYVGGGTYGDLDAVNPDPEDPDFFLHKYDSAGTVVWALQDGTSDSDYLMDMALDGAGNVYVGSERNYSIESEFFTQSSIREYASSDGGLTASTDFATEASDTYVPSIAVDAGGVYVLRSVQIPESNSNYILVGLSLDLDETLWEAAGPTSYDVNGQQLAVDGAGHVYVTGDLWDARYDGFVRQYTTDGVLRWSQEFGTASDETAYGIAPSAAGDIYVVGQTYGTFDGFTNAGYFDGFLVKVTEDALVAPTITTQPEGAHVRVGDAVSLYADATSEGGWALYMQWERDTGGGWSEITGETSPELTFTAAKTDDGLYRARFENGGAPVYSDEVTVTVSDAAITISSATVSKGSTTVTFSTSGTPTLTTFQCNLGKGKQPWIACTSGVAVKGSGKTVIVRGQSATGAPWVQSAAFTITR